MSWIESLKKTLRDALHHIADKAVTRIANIENALDQSEKRSVVIEIPLDATDLRSDENAIWSQVLRYLDARGYTITPEGDEPTVGKAGRVKVTRPAPNAG